MDNCDFSKAILLPLSNLVVHKFNPMNFKHFLAIGLWASASLAFAHEPYSPPYSDEDSTKKAPENWFNLDPEENKVPGVSTEKAYRTLLKNKKSKTVIVAVIDSGVDIEHEDLQGKIWVNKTEIPDNGKDDDGNGYIDDVNGWNFIGGKEGKHVNEDTYELTRLYVQLHQKYDGKSKLEVKDKEEFEYYQEIKTKFEKKYKEAQENYNYYKILRKKCAYSERLLKAYLDLSEEERLTEEYLMKIRSSDETIAEALNFEMKMVQAGYSVADFDNAIDYFESGVKYGYNTEFNPRDIVGDNYKNYSEKGYGNNSVEGPDAEHGTHVAGIIAANRENDLGIKGVATNVKIMPIRTVPNGDERDKDVANAIRYAVDNGAKIINMSFGKSYSPGKKYVDEAVQYAASKGVLLVHAAGNESKNLDESDNFPNKYIGQTQKNAENWLEVGACSWKGGKEMPAEFSNYGQNNVDIFAPGVAIHATTPDNNYKSLNGTSMAAPVASGVAALILSYYPNLSATQVKEIIMKSATNFGKQDVVPPGAEDDKKTVSFKKLSVTGGVINAYKALKMAEKKSKSLKKNR